MKLCPTCGQPVADEIAVCPACGGRERPPQAIDDYRIVDVLHEGYSTFLCRAIRERTDEHVMIRLFTPRSGVNAEVAARLQRELEELKKLPDEGFVRHYAIRRSRTACGTASANGSRPRVGAPCSPRAGWAIDAC